MSCVINKESPNKIDELIQTNKYIEYDGETKKQSAMLPFVEKYRPTDFNDILSNTNTIKNLNNLIENHKLPHMLFYGPPGTGKTSTIMACARKLYGNNYSAMTLELNGSDDRGINIVRQNIREFAHTNKLFRSGIKLVILDEVDSMTYDAQFALRRVIEKYTYNVRFCLICNYINKIIPALQSRCFRFKFTPLNHQNIFTCLSNIAVNENIDITQDSINAIIKLNNGDLRKSINTLQMVSTTTVTPSIIYNIMGHPTREHIDTIMTCLLTQPINDAFQCVYSVKQLHEYLLQDVIKQLVDRVIDPSTKLSNMSRINILSLLVMIEIQSSTVENDRLHIGAIVSAFYLNRG